MWWSQVISMALLLYHNHQLYSDPEAFKRWQQSFDIANIVIEMLYLIDLKKCSPFTFSIFAGIGLFTCIEYATFEAGHRDLANQFWYVRVWTDCVALYLLSWVIMFGRRKTNERRVQKETTSRATQTTAQT